MTKKGEKKVEEEPTIATAGIETAPEADPIIDEAELKRQSDAIEAKKKKASPNGERTYNAEEVRAMLEQVLKQAKGEDKTAAEKRVPTVRLPRFNNKFIIGFKNVNTDEYYAEQEIFSFDVWDDKIKQNVAWVTVLFDDGTDINLPLRTAVQQSRPVKCELVDTKKEDKSYSIGKVEQQVNEDYRMKGNGATVDMSVKVAKYTYMVKLPTTGKIVEVPADVLNW